MPLLENNTRFTINNMEQYDEVCVQLNKQLTILHSTSQQFSTKVALYEAVHNAMEHGDFPISIQFVTQPNDVTITVRDQGEGFLVSKKINLIQKQGLDQLLDEQKFSTRGRGIYMMCKMVSQVVFNDKGNEVSLIIKEV
ncbi:ATP-binding protein [Bacillus pinisoli]|uniref:ATP-binding protein n=1 Tax=Bacillus pinisoli TaxID=2901866 RepID=UPI001FF30DAC|nr:ATP-binding protein [Bacillus pinisoli]